MSRIYVVTAKKGGGVSRYVRAATLAGAIRAHSAEVFDARPVSTDEMYQASRNGVLDVLDALSVDEAVA